MPGGQQAGGQVSLTLTGQARLDAGQAVGLQNKNMSTNFPN